MRLLLLSNSTNPGEDFLSWAEKHITDFIGKKHCNIAFVPFAAVTISYNEYEKKVKEKFSELGYNLTSIHNSNNPTEVINNADIICIGGGNTFQLLKTLQDLNLLNAIREKVINNTPYIGWSAGSNIACPTICTTNDMPIVQPANFRALNFVPFQINPHYNNASIPNHGGETRDERIFEYLTANPTKTVIGLPESTLIKVENDKTHFFGNKNAPIFKKNFVTYVLNKEIIME